MGSSSKTGNYALSQWAAADTLTHGDVNADNALVDAALKSLSDGISALPAALVGQRFCRVMTGTYTGTGVYGPSGKNSLTFPVTPKFVMIMNAQNGFCGIGNCFSALWGLSAGPRLWIAGDQYTNEVAAYSGNTMTWYETTYASRQLNESGTVYAYIAFA